MQFPYVVLSHAFAPMYPPAAFYKSASSVLHVAQSSGDTKRDRSQYEPVEVTIKIDPLTENFKRCYESMLKVTNKDTFNLLHPSLTLTQTNIENKIREMQESMQQMQANLQTRLDEKGGAQQLNKKLAAMDDYGQVSALPPAKELQSLSAEKQHKTFDFRCNVLLSDDENGTKGYLIQREETDNTEFEYLKYYVPSQKWIIVKISNQGGPCTLHPVYITEYGEEEKYAAISFKQGDEHEMPFPLYKNLSEHIDGWELRDKEGKTFFKLEFERAEHGTDVNLLSKEFTMQKENNTYSGEIFTTVPLQSPNAMPSDKTFTIRTFVKSNNVLYIGTSGNDIKDVQQVTKAEIVKNWKPGKTWSFGMNDGPTAYYYFGRGVTSNEQFQDFIRGCNGCIVKEKEQHA